MKKILSLLSVVLILIISPNIFSMNDSEFGRMSFALQKKREGTAGFQGCKNIAQCGFDGFYLCTYSPEGLCSDCEFEQFPERFVACLFCRRPSSKISESYSSFSCLTCSSMIQKMLVKKLKKTDDWRQDQTLQQGAYRCISDSHTINRKHIPIFKYYKSRPRDFDSHEKPHIYRGAILKKNGNKLHVWVSDIDIAEEDKKETTWEDCENYVYSICDKYNIFGPETGALVLEKVPENASLVYEEITDKK